MIEEKLKKVIRDVPDFPKPGIVFKDISTIMLDPIISAEILDYLVDLYKDKGFTKIAGIESRGFLFGYPLAIRLGLPFVLIRKKGKLPYKKIEYSYDLEYGSATIEVHTDAIDKRDKVLIHDDLLATGGTTEAAAKLVEKQGAKVTQFSFLIGLKDLHGEDKLKQFDAEVYSILNY